MRGFLILAFGAALLIVGVRLFETAYFTGQVSEKLYVTIIGVIFLAIGGAVGYRLRHRSPAVNTTADSPPVTVLADTPSAPGGAALQATATAREQLSGREIEVLLLIAAGHTNREIGERLFVSENTVKTHVNNIYAKLDVRRRTQAVARAKELGLLA